MDGGTAGTNQINMQELTAFINSNKKKSKSKKKTIGYGKKGAPTMEEEPYSDTINDQLAAGANRRGLVSTKAPKAKSNLGKAMPAQTQEAVVF